MLTEDGLLDLVGRSRRGEDDMVFGGEGSPRGEYPTCVIYALDILTSNSYSFFHMIGNHSGFVNSQPASPKTLMGASN